MSATRESEAIQSSRKVLADVTASLDTSDTMLERLRQIPGSADQANQSFIALNAAMLAMVDKLPHHEETKDERDKAIDRMVKAGREIDPGFPSPKDAASWRPGIALPDEHGSDVSNAQLETRATHAEQISRLVERSDESYFSKRNRDLSSAILRKAVSSTPTSAFSVYKALQNDITVRNRVETLKSKRHQYFREPGVGRQTEKKKERQDENLKGSQTKSIDLAVEAIKNDLKPEDRKAAIGALVRAAASDKKLRVAFTAHEAFQSLVGAVGDPGLNRVLDDMRSDPDKDHVITQVIIDPRDAHLFRPTSVAERDDQTERGEDAAGEEAARSGRPTGRSSEDEGAGLDSASASSTTGRPGPTPRATVNSSGSEGLTVPPVSKDDRNAGLPAVGDTVKFTASYTVSTGAEIAQDYETKAAEEHTTDEDATLLVDTAGGKIQRLTSRHPVTKERDNDDDRTSRPRDDNENSGAPEARSRVRDERVFAIR